MAFFKLKKIFDIDLIYWMVFFAVPAGVIGLIIAHNGNSYKTSSNDKNPKLRTRMYELNGDGDIFCQKIEKIIPTLSTYGLNWKLISSDCNPVKENPYIIKAEVPVLFFIDDLEIRIRPSSDGKNIFVDVHSRSRIGKNDFGENKRHILSLFDAMDEHFK